MPLRIAIVGSFSTGKTTLAEALARKLELPLLPETAREVVELGFKLDKDATPETEALIFLKQYNNELSNSEFVGDRSLIDVMAYAGWVLDNRPRAKEMALESRVLPDVFAMPERRVKHATRSVRLRPRDGHVRRLILSRQPIRRRAVEREKGLDAAAVVRGEVIDLVHDSKARAESGARRMARLLDDDIDRGLIAVRLEFSAEHVDVTGFVVIRV